MAVQRRNRHFSTSFICRKAVAVLLLGLLLLGLLKPSAGLAQAGILEGNTLIVSVEPGYAPDALTEPLQAAGFEALRNWPEFGLIELRALPVAGSAASADSVHSADASASIDRLQALPGVQMVERNGRIQTAERVTASPAAPEAPSPDPLAVHQWALPQLHLPAAWTITHGSPAVTVALVDSGLDVTHEDLRDVRLWTNVAEAAGVPGVDDDGNGFVDDVHGWDWVERDADPNDRKGHGTHVGGILAAMPENGLGITGMSDGLSVLPLRVLDENGSGYISDLVDALYYAYVQNIRVVNLSLVMSSPSPAIEQAIQQLHASGTLVVAATGNVGSHVLWPAAYPETLAVAATNQNDQRASFSNFGPEVDLAAPGVQILSTAVDGGYIALDGTSMATPFVSGLAGMVWSLRPELTLDELTQILTETADDVNVATAPGRDDELGAGRLNVEAALRRAAAGVPVQITAPSEMQSGDSLAASIRLGLADAPARGAVVRYALRPADEAGSSPSAWTGSATSDEGGLAQLAMETAGLSGQYVLQVDFGGTLHEQLIDVRFPIYTVDVQTSAQTLTAGEGTAALRIEVRDAEGKLVRDELPLSLSATLGRFGGSGDVLPSDAQAEAGTVSISAVLQNGVYEGVFQAGQTAGTALLVAEAGNVRIEREIAIVPAAPAMLVWNDLPATLPRSSEPQTLALSLTLLDAYGNPVASETPVELTASSGMLTIADQASEGQDRVVAANISGTLEVTLHLAASVEPVVIRASAPEIGLQAQATLRVAGAQIMLPIVMSGGR